MICETFTSITSSAVFLSKSGLIYCDLWLEKSPQRIGSLTNKNWWFNQNKTKSQKYQLKAEIFAVFLTVANKGPELTAVDAIVNCQQISFIQVLSQLPNGV